MKKCTRCGEVKELTEFHNKSAAKDGKQSHCKVCGITAATQWNRNNPILYQSRSRRNQLLAKHGFTEDEWAELVSGIESKCQLCGTVIELLHVDHDHSTGLVRGAICTHCNRGLGAFYDSPELLQKAIEYLANPPLSELKKYSRSGTRADKPNGWRPGRNTRSKKVIE